VGRRTLHPRRGMAEYVSPLEGHRAHRQWRQKDLARSRVENVRGWRAGLSTLKAVRQVGAPVGAYGKRCFFRNDAIFSHQGEASAVLAGATRVLHQTISLHSEGKLRLDQLNGLVRLICPRVRHAFGTVPVWAPSPGSQDRLHIDEWLPVLVAADAWNRRPPSHAAGIRSGTA